MANDINVGATQCSSSISYLSPCGVTVTAVEA